MLHFPPKKLQNMYIGVCGWGMASHIVEKKFIILWLSNKSWDGGKYHRTETRGTWVVLCFWALGSRNLSKVMKKKHLYLKAADAYSISILASQIWKKEWDRELLPDAMVFYGFELKLKGLYDKDPKIRLSILDVFMWFTSNPFKPKMPKCCFHKKI